MKCARRLRSDMNEEQIIDLDYAIKLDIFEGPLDLLMYLIKKNEIDIYNIPIALITEGSSIPSFSRPTMART